MTEISAPPSVAEVKATHFDPEGKALLNPPKEQSEPMQPEKRGLFPFFKRQREVLPQQPEGPKHVLEALQEMNAIGRHKQSVGKFGDLIDALHTRPYTTGFLSGYGVNLDVARVAQGNAATGSLPQTPSEIQEIYDLLEKPGSKDHISGLKVNSKNGPQEVGLQSSNGIQIRLRLPLQGLADEYPGNYLRLQVECTEPIDDIRRAALKSIEDKYANREKLLAVTESMVSYSEKIVDVLPGIAELVLKKKDEEFKRYKAGLTKLGERKHGSPTSAGWAAKVEEDQALLFQKLAEKVQKSLKGGKKNND